MTTYENNYSTAHSFRGANIPVFMPVNMEQPMAYKATTQPQQAEISLLDVKELYDRAYDEKAQKGTETEDFKLMLADAVKMDLAYRRQLTKNAVYKDTTQQKTFDKASGGEKAEKGSKVA